MALQTSGAISLANVQTEFGGVNPISISEYYGKVAGIPASGTISLSHFYGKSNIIREPESGEYYALGTTHWMVVSGNNLTSVKWNGVFPIAGQSGQLSSYSVSGYTYYRGTYRGKDKMGTYYGVYRINN